MKIKEEYKLLAKLALCEAIVAAATIGVFAIFKKFDYRVITGAAIGVAAVLLYFYLIIKSTENAFEKAEEATGGKQMEEEEAVEFAKKEEGHFKARTQIFYIIRIIIVGAVLICAFVMPWVNGVAAVVPLMFMSPILMIIGGVRR